MVNHNPVSPSRCDVSLLDALIPRTHQITLPNVPSIGYISVIPFPVLGTDVQTPPTHSSGYPNYCIAGPAPVQYCQEASEHG